MRQIISFFFVFLCLSSSHEIERIEFDGVLTSEILKDWGYNPTNTQMMN